MIDDLELVNRIYEAAFIPEMWPAVLGDLSRIAICYGGTLLSMDCVCRKRKLGRSGDEVRPGWRVM
ncbi:hypothetical protein V1289_001741 [Bradyrhizobium sp. AZCC 2289]